MLYRVEDIVKDVRVALDENERDLALEGLGDEDTLLLDELIRSKVEEGVEAVEKGASPARLESGHSFGEDLYWEVDGERGFVLLPDDFSRLVCFKMSDWDVAVYKTITPEDVQYGRQWCSVASVRGNVHRPVCAIVRRAEGLALEFFACRDNTAKITQAVYIPKRKIDDEGRIDMSEGCYKAAVSYIAALVLMSMGNDRAKSYVELSKSMMQ